MMTSHSMDAALKGAPCKPWLMTLALVLADLSVTALVWTLCVLARHALGGDFRLSAYWSLWPLLGLYVAIYAALGGYRILLHPPREMKICTLGTSLAALLFAALTFWLRNPLDYSRSILLAATVLLLLAVPAMRLAVKALCGRLSWWGYPAVFYGFDAMPPQTVTSLLARLDPSIRPLALLTHDPSHELLEAVGLPVLDGAEALSGMGETRVNGLFIVLAGTEATEDFAKVMETASAHFTKTIILHDAMYLGNHWGRTVDVGNLLGLEIMQRLMDPKRMLLKKSTDILFSVILLLFALPVMGLIALCIKMDSRGPAFYTHERIGRGGRTFAMFKFRTMVCNSEEVFQDIMADEDLRSDWEAKHKLCRDPRVTRVGRFLRRTSLDELPQLFNVLAGDMSLIGPRPIVAEEREKYGEVFEMYLRVRPGMTGLWQVSGRSTLDYPARVELDAYYIKNWSFWLDLSILIKTPAAMCNLQAAF